MAKQKSGEIGADHSVGATSAAVIEREPDPSPTHEQIAALAYALWQARGGEAGSPDDDWFRAESELNGSGQQTA
jgi:hypothetical protein